MQKSVQVRQQVKGVKRWQENAVTLHIYVDKLEIERRVWSEPRKPGEKSDVRVAEKITLSYDETNTIAAMLPLALLEQQRARRAKKSKKESCYSADI